MTDVQAHDDEARFFLYENRGAKREEIWMIRLVSQGNIARSIP